MTNKEIAKTFQLLGNIMELHGENPFKIRSYQSAYRNLRKLDRPLAEMSPEEIGAIKGIGKAITGKIGELLNGGKMATLERYIERTPPGVVEMLGISGFGPKKIRTIWQDLGAETIGELLYACNENRLIEIKGFGEKTQADLRIKLEYYLRSKGRFRYAQLEAEAKQLLAKVRQRLRGARVEWTGALRRGANIVDRIELLVGQTDLELLFEEDLLIREGQTADYQDARNSDGFPVRIYSCTSDNFGTEQFRRTATTVFLESFRQLTEGQDFSNLAEESAVFERTGLSYLPPELRDTERHLSYARSGKVPVLVEETEMRGVVHLHTNWSDGLNTIREMADACRARGYEYMGLTDHSKSAFYANGLKVDRLLQQWAEVDALNEEYEDFRIFKGIESDILSDGSLDYDEDILQRFDFIIASVHSNLKMDEAKATTRLINAIEHPHTTILGHPTGRLLLSRPGYPIDHQRIIDACAEHNVAIELNANPYRLDLDYSWIPYAVERGVPVSINPDAHSTGGIDDIRYGTLAARKGGLTKAACWNAKDLLPLADKS